MFWHRFHREDESFFNPPRCVTTQQATGHCKRKEDLNTLLFRARRYKRSPFEETLRCSPLVARRHHNRTMFESDTYETDEAHETDETRNAPAVTSLVTAWYHRKHGGNAMTTSNTVESTVKDTPNARKTFFGGFEKPREKNFIFAVEADESDSHQRQKPLNRRNQAVEALAAIQTNNFANNNNNNNNNYCYQVGNNTYNATTKKISIVTGLVTATCEEVGA